MATLTVPVLSTEAWMRRKVSPATTYTTEATSEIGEIIDTLPVGWSTGEFGRKCRASVYFDTIDFSSIGTINSATMTFQYSDPTPDFQVNQSCTASRTLRIERRTVAATGSTWATGVATGVHFNNTSTISVTLAANLANFAGLSANVLSIVNAWKNGDPQEGIVLRISTDTTDTFSSPQTTPLENKPGAGFVPSSFEIVIDYTPLPVSPIAPQLVIQNIATDGGTLGSTTPIKSFSASTATQCNLRFSFIDDNEAEGDYCYAYQIEVYNNSGYTGSPIWSENKVTTGQPTGTITYVLDFNNVPKDTNLYWRARVIDTNPGTEYSPWSAATNGSGSSQERAVFIVQAATVEPPPPGGGGGNPEYTSIVTFARNRFRVEFYGIQDTITAGLEEVNADDNPQTPLPSFNPTPNKNADGTWRPSAIIHDAKAIGVSQQVNGGGEFFLTLPSNHPQIGAIVPLRTFWRVCRWDEKAGYFIVAGEGMVTETTSSPNEVIVYGTDKLGMLSRLVVPVDKTLIGAYYTFQNFRLDQIHDALLPAAGGTEQSITRSVTTRASVAGTSGSVVTLTTSVAHGFVQGDPVTVANVNDTELNGTFIVNTVPTTTTFTYKITNKNKVVASGSAGATATAVVNRFTRNMFEPFQGSRRIIAGSTDVSNSPSTSTYRTVTETKSIMCDGKSYLDTLAEFCDILMAGTTDVVIIEDPNIGLPADNPSNLYQGIQYRHLKEADIPSPKFWLKYGDSVTDFKYQPFQSKIATRAGVLNYAYDTGGTSTSTFGIKSALNFPLYDNYGLIEIFEKIDDERNDIQYAANMLYNRYPNQVVEFNLQVVSSQITPFTGYQVGDLIQVYIKRRNVSVADKFALTRQEWIGNEDGSESITFLFSPQQRLSFLAQL